MIKKHILSCDVAVSVMYHTDAMAEVAAREEEIRFKDLSNVTLREAKEDILNYDEFIREYQYRKKYGVGNCETRDARSQS